MLQEKARSALRHPRVVVSLVALMLIVVPLGFLSHGLDEGQPDDALRLTASAVPSAYGAFTTNADFSRGTRSGTAIMSGSVRIGAAPNTRSWGGRTYEFGTWSSPWVSTSRPYRELVGSWTATTPAGSWIQVLVRAKDDTGKLSGTKVLANWATGDAVVKRSSGAGQQDAVARIATDTLVATGRPLTAYRLTVRLMRSLGGAGPTLGSIGAVTSVPSTTVPTVSAPLQSTAVSLPVPRYSQMTHLGQNPEYGGGGEAWCSPTSLAMVLGYYGRLPDPSTYTWVRRTYPDRFVNHIARLTFDHRYDGTGNWSFNTAYAATRTGEAFVTRLANLRMAERFLRAGIPLVLSIRFSQGQLTGAPISATNGHLLVLTGLTATGRPIVNDPAASTNSAVRRSYDRAQFERAWLRSGGTAYVVRDARHPLPVRPAGVHAW